MSLPAGKMNKICMRIQFVVTGGDAPSKPIVGVVLICDFSDTILLTISTTLEILISKYILFHWIAVARLLLRVRVALVP